ncbi:hypothetical protein K438DRAFT_1625856 [Mycena galopus ATCC 62051]|nr:hypothetical protein K438DRAFT_1625856 [Mycena galopus ATCC 62051]
MLPREEILGLLASMGIELPPKTKLNATELDKRLSKALDSAQYITRVVPPPPLDPTAYPLWSRTKSSKPVLEAIKRNNVAEATLVSQSKMFGIDNPFPRLYTNAFMDLRQTLMSIANACDNGMIPITLQDKEESSGICMRVSHSQGIRRRNANYIVVFHHDVKDSLSQASFDWISSYVSGSAVHATMAKVTATVAEQHLLLRLLNQNKKRLVSSYKPTRASTESAFTLSFLLPVGPLGAQEMAKYNADNGCSICGEPAKQKCSRCGTVRYCNAVCQKEDWKAHRPLCNSWQGAKWQSLTFVSADHPRPNTTALRYNKYDSFQNGGAQQRLARMTQENFENPAPPSNTHGTSPFIIKLQVNSSRAQDGTEMLIYDQRRTIEVTVLRTSEETSFDTIKEVVYEKGERGLKAFFWAVRTGEWTMDVRMDQFPEWQKW